MKILSIFANNILHIDKDKNNHTDCSYQYRSVLTSELKCDTVSFKRTAKNAEKLRMLMTYKIPDMYSGKIIIDPLEIEKLVKEGIFSSSIRNVVKALKPFEECLFDVEAKVLKILKRYKDPNKRICDVINSIAPEHNKKLIELQTPIFNELIELSKQMPEEQKQEFDNYMDIVCKKINREPVSLPFSAKEFQYKLKRIASEIAVKRNKNENELMNKILKLAKQMPEKTLDETINLKDIRSKAKISKKEQMNRSLIQKRAAILKYIEAIRIQSSLKTNKDLERLVVSTRFKIYNLPVITPFSRKPFIHDLEKITNTLKDTKLAHKIIQTALKLPTSHDNVSAFIVKFADRSSETIGYNLIEPSSGSIEHLIPFKKGGEDCLENYSITAKLTNKERGIRSMHQQLKKYPEIYQNAQKQIDRLIQLANNGTFKKIGLSPMYIINLVQKMYKMSPKEKRLILDIRNLKQ